MPYRLATPQCGYYSTKSRINYQAILRGITKKILQRNKFTALREEATGDKSDGVYGIVVNLLAKNWRICYNGQDKISGASGKHKEWSGMEEVLKSVKEAEAKAASLKAEAEAEAEQLIAASRARANEIQKASEEELKLYRETTLKEAELRIQKEAQHLLSDNESKEAKAADALLKDTSSAVSQIVRRVIDGDCRHA